MNTENNNDNNKNNKNNQEQKNNDNQVNNNTNTTQEEGEKKRKASVLWTDQTSSGHFWKRPQDDPEAEPWIDGLTGEQDPQYRLCKRGLCLSSYWKQKAEEYKEQLEQDPEYKLRKKIEELKGQTISFIAAPTREACQHFILRFRRSELLNTITISLENALDLFVLHNFNDNNSFKRFVVNVGSFDTEQDPVYIPSNEEHTPFIESRFCFTEFPRWKTFLNNYKLNFKTWEVLAITYLIDRELKELNTTEEYVARLSCLGKYKLFVTNTINFLQTEIKNVIYKKFNCNFTYFESKHKNFLKDRINILKSLDLAIGEEIQEDQGKKKWYNILETLGDSDDAEESEEGEESEQEEE